MLISDVLVAGMRCYHVCWKTVQSAYFIWKTHIWTVKLLTCMFCIHVVLLTYRCFFVQAIVSFVESFEFQIVTNSSSRHSELKMSIANVFIVCHLHIRLAICKLTTLVSIETETCDFARWHKIADKIHVTSQACSIVQDAVSWSLHSTKTTQLMSASRTCRNTANIQTCAALIHCNYHPPYVNDLVPAAVDVSISAHSSHHVAATDLEYRAGVVTLAEAQASDLSAARSSVFGWLVCIHLRTEETVKLRETETEIGTTYWENNGAEYEVHTANLHFTPMSRNA